MRIFEEILSKHIILFFSPIPWKARLLKIHPWCSSRWRYCSCFIHWAQHFNRYGTCNHQPMAAL